MNKNKLIVKFADEEQECCVCNKPLPAHETWPGARYPFCGSAECSASLKAKRPFSQAGVASQVGLYIGQNERKCEAPSCTNFIPEGRYDARNSFHTCCGDCWIERHYRDQWFLCGCGCGKEFMGNSEKKVLNGLRFLDMKHYGAYLKKQSLESCPVELRPIVEEFLDGFAVLHYGDYYTFSRLRSFFEFLKLEGIKSLDDVTSRTVTQYLIWAAKTGHRNAPESVRFLSTFFKWAIGSGYRKYASPIISLMHYSPRPKRLPRPLEPEELSLAWEILQARGNARLRLVVAIGEESGLRLGEICRLRLQDFHLVSQTLFVRLPNKGKEERYAFFSEKTKQYYAEWMAERDAECKHDRLLHSIRGRKCNIHNLTRELSGVLCKEYGGKKRNEDGFDKWSSHRLRHLMASRLLSAGANAATIMAAGGWKTFEAMSGYARGNSELAHRGYDEAMRLAREQKLSAFRKKSLSLEEFLQYKRKTA